MDRSAEKFKSAGTPLRSWGCPGVETQPDGGNEITESEHSAADRTRDKVRSAFAVQQGPAIGAGSIAAAAP